MLIAATMGISLGFAAFTQHAWEDYFITLRSSRHLVEGNGLVFNPGERVHTFTSPLGVLIPAACTMLAGPGREEVALWWYRVLSAALLGAMVWLVWRRAESLRLGGLGRFVLFGLLMADAKLVDFSINGMETALLVFFALLLWAELELPRPRVGRLAGAIAGLMWTRPDAFVLGGAMILARLVLPDRDGVPVRPWPQLLRGIVLGGVLYAPWLIWAWWYYGSPIPHTIIAKSAYTPAFRAESWLLLPWQTLTGQSMLLDLFLPSYWTFGGWPAAAKHVAHALAGIAAFAWVVPRLPKPARRASLAVFIGMFYLCSIILFPWYVPPWTALAAIALAWTIDALHRSAQAAGRPIIAAACRIGAVVVVLVQMAMLAASAVQMRVHQRVVENGVRRDIGEWLHRTAAKSDTVFLEPLGYIGYFSQLKTHDFPGLSSPEVVAVIREGARRYADVIARLRPTWVVLRPHEAARPEFGETGVLRGYERVREWDAIPQLNAVPLLPGRAWVEAEARYLVYRRIGDAESARPAR